MGKIVKLGQVEEISTDPAGALRIKARTPQDQNGNVPWAFPLLPKEFQVVPKIGEGVFIIDEDDANNKSNRYYIGPIISQNQFNEKCNYAYGRGPASSCLQGAPISPLPNIDNDARTRGSFPQIGDVAVVGRDSQDMIMKRDKNTNVDEVDIRCGIRKKDDMLAEEGEYRNVGKIIFNNVDPAYIQLKYGPNLAIKASDYDPITDSSDGQSSTNSAINIVADKINLIGVQDDSLNVNKTDNNSLIKDSDMSQLMLELHQLPKGDVLVKCLHLLINAFLTHTHNYNGLPPVNAGDVTAISLFNLNDILSQYVRIS